MSNVAARRQRFIASLALGGELALYEMQPQRPARTETVRSGGRKDAEYPACVRHFGGHSAKGFFMRLQRREFLLLRLVSL